MARESLVRCRVSDEVKGLLQTIAAQRQITAVLVRSHLRDLAPLPKEELMALKRSVAELGGIGRNLNQIVRLANQGSKPAGPGREDLRAMLSVAEGLRDHVKALLKANQISWKQGHAQTTA